MNYFLAYEEVKAEADANGYVAVSFDYTLVEEYVFGEPESKKPATESAE